MKTSYVLTALLLMFLGLGSVGYGQVTLATFNFESSNLNASSGAIGSPVLTASATVSYFSGSTTSSTAAASFASANGKYFELTISTLGYNSITVNWNARTSGATSSWVVTANDGTGYGSTLATQTLSTSFAAATPLVLGASFNNNSSIKIRWTANVSATQTIRIDDIVISGTSAGNTAPVLSTPTSANITNTTSTLGATISSNGGVEVIESGIVYGTSASPTGNATQTSPTTTSGAFTVAVSSLSPQTLYYYRGYAVNSVGTGYSSDGTFRTLSNPPTAQASSLAGTPGSTTSINLTWSAAAFPGSGATTTGYVLLRATSPNSPSLSNSNGAAPAAGTNTTIVSSSLTGTSTAVSSLTANTTYNFLLVPFCWDGTNASTYNYLTASAPTVSVATQSNVSDVVAVGSSESATISSLVNDDAPLSSSTGAQVWQITVRDGGSTLNDADNLPTIVTGITLSQGTGNAIDNWLDAIKTIALFDGTNFIASASSITSTTVVFSGLNVSVADNASKTLSLRLSLNSPLNNAGSGNLDGDDFVFSLTSANFTTLSDGTSSTKSSFSTISSTNGQNAVAVVATKLLFVQQPTNVVTNTNISPAVTVQATDAGGNRDRDFVSSISITATGSTLTGSPVSAAAINGLATFSTLQLTDAATGVTLTAAFTGLTSATSNTFNVTLPLSSFSYRTLRSGNWNDVTSSSEVWERSTDGEIWSTVTSSGDLPNSSAGTITIRNGHTVTITSSTNLDQCTIEAGAQLTINSSQTLTVAEGTGTDLNVSGTLLNKGTITNNGQMSFSSSSVYKHDKDGGTIPTNTTWDANSTIEVTGIILSIPTFSSSVTYGNLIWNSTGQTATIQMSGSIKNISGNFSVLSTGSGKLRLNSASLTLTIGGNLSLSGSSYVELSNNSTGTYIIDLTGDFSQSGTSTFSPNISTSVLAFNLKGANKSFTFSGGTLTNSNINWTINTGATISLNNDLPVALSRTLTVNGTLNCGTNAVSGSGTFTLSSGATLISSNATGLTGSITTTNKSFSSAANYEFKGASTGAFTTTPTGNTVNNLTINNASGVSLGQSIAVDGVLTLQSGEFNTTGYTLSIGPNGSVVYSGGSINPALVPTTVNNYTPPSGTTLTSSPTVNGTLSLSNGSLTIASGQLLTLGSTGSLSGETSGNYLIGAIQTSRSLSGSSAVDIGGMGVVINPQGNTLGLTTVKRIAGNDGIVNVGGKTGIKRKWIISPVSQPTGEVSVTLNWVTDDDNNKAINALYVWKRADENHPWISIAGPLDGSTTRSVTFTTTSFSEFTLTDNDNPLPVELTSFSAKLISGGIALNWKTATEVNNYGFEVQRTSSSVSLGNPPSTSLGNNSGTERNWENVGFVAGNGNSNSEKSYSFTDRNVASATKYVYRLKQIDTDGKFDYSNEVEVTTGVPDKFELSQNYPNPFNPSTMISYTLPRAANVKIEIYDVAGNLISVPVSAVNEAGTYSVSVDFAKDQRTSGMYFCRMTATGQDGALLFNSVNKMVLMK